MARIVYLTELPTRSVSFSEAVRRLRRGECIGVAWHHDPEDFVDVMPHQLKPNAERYGVFYRRHFAEKRSPAAALRAAREMLKRHSATPR